jgi:deoxyribodipyrimidine photolyase-related protein
VLASKPYAASANYINKMSNYCWGCKFDRTVLAGENACPFNFSYWDFLARHRDKLQSIGPMSFIDRQSRQNAAERIGNHPPKSRRLALNQLTVVSCQLSVDCCQLLILCSG